MTAQCCESISDTEYVAQLARHLSSVPATRIACSKRGAVSIVIRLVTSSPEHTFSAVPFPDICSDSPAAMQQSLAQYLTDPGMHTVRAQLLFIQRAQYPGDPWSGHIGFPGGKQEPSDMGDLQKTAERETLEELGIPANTLLCLGRLDDVPAVTPLGKTIIVVSPWVFLQVRQSTDMMLSAEVASAHWVDLRQLLEPTLATHAAILRTTRGGSTWVHRGLAHLGLASMQYPVVRLAYRTECSVQSRGGASYGPFASCGELRLWGLSLIMAGNLVDWARSAECPLGAPRLTGWWPRLSPVLWADFNLLMRLAHRVCWQSPSKRSPLSPLAPGYFTAFQRAARVAFPLACALKVCATYVLVRRVCPAVYRIMLQMFV